MPTLQYTVFEDAAEVAMGAPIQEGTVTIAGTANNSAGIVGTGNRGRRVRIYCDTDAWVTWGASGITALNDGTEGRMMGADNPEYFFLQSGWEISVIERV